MRWIVVPPEHLNHDTIENTDRRHGLLHHIHACHALCLCRNCSHHGPIHSERAGLRIPLIVKPGSQSSRQQNAAAFYTDRVAQGYQVVRVLWDTTEGNTRCKVSEPPPALSQSIRQRTRTHLVHSNTTFPLINDSRPLCFTLFYSLFYSSQSLITTKFPSEESISIAQHWANLRSLR